MKRRFEWRQKWIWGTGCRLSIVGISVGPRASRHARGVNALVEMKMTEIVRLEWPGGFPLGVCTRHFSKLLDSDR